MTNPAHDYGFSHLITPKEREGIIRRHKERAARRVEEREHLRLEIDARACIVRMIEIREAFTRGYETSREFPDVEIPIDPNRSTHLKNAADIADKLLKKVLPDLKAIELDTSSNLNTEEDDELSADDIALANRLRLWKKQKLPLLVQKEPLDFLE